MCRCRPVRWFAGACCVDGPTSGVSRCQVESSTVCPSPRRHTLGFERDAPIDVDWSVRQPSCSSVTIGAATLLVGPPAAAQMSEEAAKQAAREIQAARDSANAAAAAFLQAQSDLEVLQDQARGLEGEEAVLRERVEQPPTRRRVAGRRPVRHERIEGDSVADRPAGAEGPDPGRGVRQCRHRRRQQFDRRVRARPARSSPPNSGARAASPRHREPAEGVRATPGRSRCRSEAAA